MKATLRDFEALMAISPLDLASYLRSAGWVEQHVINQRGSIWVKNVESNYLEILLPLDKSLRDYAMRVGDVIATLEEAENRSQLDILRDLMGANSDIVRISANYIAARDGTMLIEDGVECLQKIREMVLASACSVIKPKAVHSTRKPDKAIDYIQKVRLGQTERGSYVFSIVSKVPPQLSPDDAGQLFPPHEDEPFERTVTKTLACALDAIVNATQRAAATGKLEYFMHAVERGVSSNLCDAIVALGRRMDPTKGMPIRFSWSPARPIRDNVPSLIVLSQDSLPVIEEASRLMKATSPGPEVETTGYVIALQRDEPELAGRIQILDIESDRPRKMFIELQSTLYNVAIIAHSEGKKIKCSGELVKEGRNFVLKNPTGFRIVEE